MTDAPRPAPKTFVPPRNDLHEFSADVVEGFDDAHALAALISINLGILNLLPIPVLDGGQIVFCLWEIIFRRPPNPRFQEYAMRVGIALLVCLMLLATYNDLWRILKNTGWFGSGS